MNQVETRVPQLDTLLHQHEILDTYEHTLPPKPEEVMLTIVIPAYAELSGLLRLLESLTWQKSVDTRYCEVLYVVNNPISDVFEDKPEFKENCDTLAILRLCSQLRSQETSPSLSQVAEEVSLLELRLSEKDVRTIWRYCTRSPVSVLAIDAMSSFDPIFRKELSKGERPGAARHVGGVLAHSRQKGNDGYISFIDGDCRFPPGYFSKLSSSLQSKKDAYVNALAVEQLDPFRVVAADNFQDAVFSLRYSAVKTAYLFSAHQGFADTAGPSPIVRASLFEQVGGYPVVEQETIAFMKAVEQHTVPEYLAAYMLLDDRVRAASYYGSTFPSSDGLATFTLEMSLMKDTMQQPTDSIEWLLTRDKWCLDNLDATQKTEYLRLRAEYFEIEKRSRRLFQSSMLKLFRKIDAAHPSTLMATTAEIAHTIEAAVKHLPERYRTLFLDNLKAVHIFAKVLHSFSTSSGLKTAVDVYTDYNPITPTFEDRQVFDLSNDSSEVQQWWKMGEYYLPEFFLPPLKEEPQSYRRLYAETLGADHESGLPNLRDFLHLAQAQFRFWDILPFSTQNSKKPIGGI